MKKAKSGDYVRVHYRSVLEDGTLLDSTDKKKPIEFIIGNHEVKASIEQAIEGMSEGESKHVRLNPEEAFGAYSEELVAEILRTQLVDHLALQTGTIIMTRAPDGQEDRFTVTNLMEDTITLDGNHPLAGKRVSFEIELVAIV